jgi:hypothetical protein
VARRRWDELDPRTRQLIAGALAFEGTLKIAALIDLARRPAAQVRGSKLRWTIAILLVNSGGVLPVVYFRRGINSPR